MRLDFAKERVLAVVAHPDDAEMLCAGTLARAKADGAPIAVAVLCQGDKGQPSAPMADLAGVRREEMAAAAALLGGELFPAVSPTASCSTTSDQQGACWRSIASSSRRWCWLIRPSDYHADHRAASLWRRRPRPGLPPRPATRPSRRL